MLGFCVFLLAAHTNYIKLRAEQISKYILWISCFFLFNWYWHQSVSLLYLKTDIIKLISTLEIIKTFPESDFREAVWSLLNNCFKQMLGKRDYFIYVRHLHSEIFFPFTILQYPWMLSQTIKNNNILFKSKCNLASSHRRHTYLIYLVHDLNNLR